MTRLNPNHVVFVLKQIGVSAHARKKVDPRLVELFTCDELEEYIASHPRCSLFESLRDEEACSNVRVFFDVDLPTPLDEQTLVPVFREFILSLTSFVANFAVSECDVITDSCKASLIKCMRKNFSMTRSTNKTKTSFHIVFVSVYTTLDTLIAMKKPLLEFIRRSSNPLVRAIDPAVFRRCASMRVVGTRKTQDCVHVHERTPPHARIEDYLFTYVDVDSEHHYFVHRVVAPQQGLGGWDKDYIPFSDAIKRVCQVIVNEIVNISEITEQNMTSVPLVIDYVTPCALCRKVSHKHPHHIALTSGAIRIFKAGNPHSCRVKVITLESDVLFTVSQRIRDANVINLTERGDHIVWLNNAWRFSSEESIITKLVLLMRDSMDPEFSLQLLCPRNRKIVESNLRDMLIDPVETDIFPEKLPFSNGVMDISDSTFRTGTDAKDFMCTVSTGYKLDEEHSPEAVAEVRAELERIIDDIQPRTPENAENRATYEKVLSSCLCGTTKPCIFFFYGDTATGKSTTKRLLASTLHGLFVETGQTILTDVLDRGPNPFVANMHLKRAVFCSELPDFSCAGSKKIRADNIKKLTEPCIVGRQCYSNKINNRNHATIIIDTNYRPVFDKVDNALMRRVGLVRFKTHFSNTSSPLSAQYDAVKPLDNMLDRKIQSNYFRFAFLYVLVEWYQKHHLPCLDVAATPDLIPDFRFHRTIDAVIMPSNSTHVRYMPHLSKLGYELSHEGAVVMPVSLFHQRLAAHFNVRVYGHDIESFVQKHKKFASVSDEYMEYVFLEDIAD